MGLKVLIVDDETLARSRLRTLLGDCTDPRVDTIGEAANAVQAMEHIQRTAFDLVLLDIHMPGVDGMALAATLHQLPSPPQIVFVTAHAEHAVQAFELEAVDYLTKPVRLERLQQALQKVQRPGRCRQQRCGQPAGECLVIQERGRSERVPLADVVYLKAELKYITVRTVDKRTHLRRLAQRSGAEIRTPVRAGAPQCAGGPPPGARGGKAQRPARGRRLGRASGRHRRPPGGFAPPALGGARSPDGLMGWPEP